MGFILQHQETGVIAASANVVLSTTPKKNNILLAWANSDATVSTPTGITGWTAGPVQVNDNGAYFWYKTATGSESTTITFTPAASADITCGVIEIAGVSVFDVSTSNYKSSSGTSTTSISITTTGVAGSFVVVAAMGHNANPALTSPSWTNSYTEQLTAATTPSGTACTTFVATLNQTAAAATDTVGSWTNSSQVVAVLIISFKNDILRAQACL